MKYSLDFDLFIEQAVSDAFASYTLTGNNTSHVVTLAAGDLVKNWGPELAGVFREAIKAEMNRQLNGLGIQLEADNG